MESGRISRKKNMGPVNTATGAAKKSPPKISFRRMTLKEMDKAWKRMGGDTTLKKQVSELQNPPVNDGLMRSIVR